MDSSSTLRVGILVLALSLLGVGCTRTAGPAASPLPAGGVFRSDDGGATFRSTSQFAGGGDIAGTTPREVAVDPFEPRTVYIAADRLGLLRTSNAGEVWEQLTTPVAVVTSIVIHPRNPNILYLAGTPRESAERSKIWRSFDRGKTWEEIYAEARGTKVTKGAIVQFRQRTVNTVLTLAVDPQRPEVLYAGSTSSALVASTDGGRSWSTRRSFRTGISGLKVVPGLPAGQADTERIYVRLVDGGLGRSADGGRTAVPVTVRAGSIAASQTLALLSAAGESDILLAGTDRGIFRSPDGGDSWEIVPLPISTQQIVPVTTLAQSVDGTLWAGSGFNLYQSRDRGATWRIQQFSVTSPIRFVVTDPVDPRRLYVVFSGTAP